MSTVVESWVGDQLFFEMTKEYCGGGAREEENVSDESGMPFYGPTQFRLALSLLVPITMN